MKDNYDNITQEDINYWFQLIDEGLVNFFDFFITAFCISLCHPDDSGTIDRNEFYQFKNKFQSGEFKNNTDGPWSVCYDDSQNQYVFTNLTHTKQRKRAWSLANGGRKSTFGRPARTLSLRQEANILGIIPTDDGVVGKWVRYWMCEFVLFVK